MTVNLSHTLLVSANNGHHKIFTNEPKL